MIHEQFYDTRKIVIAYLYVALYSFLTFSEGTPTRISPCWQLNQRAFMPRYEETDILLSSVYVLPADHDRSPVQSGIHFAGEEPEQSLDLTNSPHSWSPPILLYYRCGRLHSIELSGISMYVITYNGTLMTTSYNDTYIINISLNYRVCQRQQLVKHIYSRPLMCVISMRRWFTPHPNRLSWSQTSYITFSISEATACCALWGGQKRALCRCDVGIWNYKGCVLYY